MLSLADIKTLFKKRGIPWGKELLFTPDVAIEFIELCQRNDLALLGFDGLALQNGVWILLEDVIADFSPGLWRDKLPATWAEYRDRCNSLGINILNELASRDNLRVTLVVMPRSEWTDSETKTR